MVDKRAWLGVWLIWGANIALAQMPRETEAEKTLKYRLVTKDQEIRIANDRAQALMAQNALLLHQIASAQVLRDKSTEVRSAALLRRLAVAQATTDKIAAQLATANVGIVQRTEEAHVDSVKAQASATQAAKAATRADRFSEILKTQQQTIMAALGVLGGLFGIVMRVMMRRVRHVREQILKIEVMTNGNLERLIAAKDELLAASVKENKALQNKFTEELARVSANIHSLRNVMVPLAGQIPWQAKTKPL